MRKIVQSTTGNTVACMLVVLFIFLSSGTFVSAEQYYECRVSSDKVKGGICEQYRGSIHMCQIYDKKYTGKGTPSFCTNFCVKRSGIPEGCAIVVVTPSSNPEAHQAKEKRIGEILSPVVSKIGSIIGKIKIVPRKIKEKVGEIKDKIINKLPWVDDEDLDELTEEDFADNSLEGTGFNEFRTVMYPDKNGVKIAKIVDPYGQERYTSDGKHFYDNPHSAAHSGEGLRDISNKISNVWNDFKGIFSFKAKLKDKDKELQREIAREVLKDAKSQREKDVEKAYKKLSGRISAPKFSDIPAKAIIEIAKEASVTDFAGGVLLYIELRKEKKSPAFIRENISEELSAGYGTFGEGVSFSTTNKYAEAVIYARYEETYQRYLLAKELGRKK